MLIVVVAVALLLLSAAVWVRCQQSVQVVQAE
jgi:hypothetical protein